MKIVKKIECLHCGSVIDGDNAKCGCGKVSLVENTIPVVLVAGVDFKDLSPKLLVE